MNQIAALITAFVMMLTGLGVVTSTQEAPVVEEMAVTLDAEAVGALIDAVVPADAHVFFLEETEQIKAAAELAANLLNGAKARVITDRGYAEASLTLNDTLLAFAAGRSDETGLAVATSLLPDTAVTVSPETAQQLILQFLQQMAQQSSEGNPLAILQSVDSAKLLAAAEEVYDQAEEELSAKIGKSETGSFTVDGLTFKKKTTVDLTEQDAKLIALKAVKSLAENEAVKPLLSRIPYGGMLMGKLDQAIEETGKETPRKLDIVLYENTDKNDSYLHIADAAEEGTEYDGPCIGLGQAGGQFVVYADSGKREPKIHAELTAGENLLTLKADIAVSEGKTLSLTMEGDLEHSQAVLAFDGREMARIAEAKATAEKVERRTDGTKNVIRLEELMAEDNSQALQTLKGRLLSGVMLTVGKIMTLIGAEQNADLLSRLIPVGMDFGMMIP